jgi:NADH dehydrogenase
MVADSGSGPPVVVLGAGYAGASVAATVRERSHRRLPVVLVDRHPVQVLRTELYEVGRLAQSPNPARRWTVPLGDVLEGQGVEVRTGEVRAINLDARTVTVEGEALSYGSLAICLGSVAAYFGVPGAEEHTHSVYRLTKAVRLAEALTKLERSSVGKSPEDRPHVVVIGGGSTGTEVAAEIATTNWSKVVGAKVLQPRVLLVVGSVPLLQGLPEGLIHHARRLLTKGGVLLDEGHNVQSVSPHELTLDNGVQLRFDLAVWCGGLQAPPLVQSLPVPHGKGGRIRVTEHLELPGHPGAFAVGDVIELEDPKTHMLVPQTAQAALAEARFAGKNLVARQQGKPLAPFVYRERSNIVSVGVGDAAGRVRSVTIWGSPAKLLKAVVDREYAFAREHGQMPPGL